MGRKSRQKRDARLRPPPPVHRPLETRWGPSPLGLTFGGMMQGLRIGAFAAAVCVLAAGLRMAGAAALGDPPGMDGIWPGAPWYVGGFLLGGAAGGALGPVRGFVGGRRTQGIVMAAIALWTWMPILRETVSGEDDPAAWWTVWAVCSLIFGLMFAKWFGIHDELIDPPPSRHPDAELPSGRHPEFR